MIVVFSVLIFHETTSNYIDIKTYLNEKNIIEGKQRYLIEDLKQPDA